MTERISETIAFTKDKHFLYIWWTDGSVSRREIVGTCMKDLEEVEPPVRWNPFDFLVRIPTGGNSDAF